MPGATRAIEPLAIGHAPSEHSELEQREQQDDQGEDECERRGETELRLLERGAEQKERDGAGRVERAATGQDVDRIERPQRADARDREDKEGGRREKGERDLGEDLALARAVQTGRLVVLRRDVRKARKEDHDLVP